MKLHAFLFVFLSNFIFAQNPLIQFPSIGPDGTMIAFNYQGDIWTADITGNNPKRITVHEAYDTKPIWAPDGQAIAFQSNRYGNYDIFTIPFNGGIPKRLTYHSTTDIITDYTKDGNILFSTRRHFAQVEREPETHIVNISGGTPYRYMNALGFDAKLSPNGKYVAFVKGHCRIQREAYQGPANRDIWLYDIKNDSYMQLTNFDGNDFYPQWGDDNTIYFQSSRSGKYNVFKLKISDSGVKESISAVTDFKDMGIFSFQISRNGKDIIAAQNDKVFLINAISNQKKQITINIQSDYRFNPIEHKEYSNEAKELAVSPNGKYLAFVVRGEIFLRYTGKELNRTVNVSKSAYRDRSVSWVNDSTLVFISDRDGQNDIYLLKSDNQKEENLLKTLKYKVERLTKTNAQESNPVLSPNGKQLAYNRGRGQLVVANLSEKGKLTNERILLDGWSTANNISWSPDSKYIVYSLSDLDFNSEVYIHKADNSKSPVNISMHPKQDSNPIWSPDGKKSCSLLIETMEITTFGLPG